MKNFLGIIGGLGSFASLYFYNMILEMTDAKTDQDHIDMMILNHASIPDRTSFLLGKIKESPFIPLKEDVEMLNNLGSKAIVITCNTAHYFYDDLKKISKVPILNIIDISTKHLNKLGVKKVGILATSGTVQMKIYQHSCEKLGIEYVLPSEEKQNNVMEIIYDNIKSNVKVDTEKWKKIISELKESEVEYIILGCTELSMLKKILKLDDKFIDPLELTVKEILHMFDKKIKE